MITSSFLQLSLLHMGAPRKGIGALFDVKRAGFVTQFVYKDVGFRDNVRLGFVYVMQRNSPVATVIGKEVIVHTMALGFPAEGGQHVLDVKNIFDQCELTPPYTRSGC